MWWISYRGEGRSGIDNIGVFEDDGTPRRDHPLLLDPSPKAHPLHIPRGFALVGDDLYIANAWRKDSHIARYRRHNDTFHFAGVLATTKQVSAMVHPFDVELGDDGRLYVSCQDTNTVVAILPKTSRPAPVAAHLRQEFPDGNFLPGHARRVRAGPPARRRRPRAPGRAVTAGPRGRARRPWQAAPLGPRDHREPRTSLRRRRGRGRRQGLRSGIGESRRPHQGEAVAETRSPRPARRDALHRQRRDRQHSRP